MRCLTKMRCPWTVHKCRLIAIASSHDSDCRQKNKVIQVFIDALELGVLIRRPRRYKRRVLHDLAILSYQVKYFRPRGCFAAMLARSSAADKDGSICSAYSSSPARFLIETGSLLPSRGPTCVVNTGNAPLPNSMKLSVQDRNASLSCEYSSNKDFTFGPLYGS